MRVHEQESPVSCVYMNRKAQFLPLADVNPEKGIPTVTVSLIAINIMAFIIELVNNFEAVVMAFGFTPAIPSILTAFTSMFLHGGIEHILGNMWYLWIFGDNVEHVLGKVRFIVFYLFAGFAATLLHFLTNLGSEIPAVGASGAISGILGAYIVLFPRAKVVTWMNNRTTHVNAIVFIGIWFVMQFFLATASLFGGSGSGIAFWAHVGGFVFGALAVKLFAIGRKRMAINS